MRDGEVDRNTSSKKKAEEVAEEQETRAKAQDRESREQTPTQSEKSLTQKERNTVSEHGNLSPLTVYSIILREGEDELRRPKISLWWSGVAAGVGISTSVLVEGIIRSNLGSDHPYLTLIESLGYSFGFVLVILCRLQLFTENTPLGDCARCQFVWHVSYCRHRRPWGYPSIRNPRGDHGNIAPFGGTDSGRDVFTRYTVRFFHSGNGLDAAFGEEIRSVGYRHVHLVDRRG